jgi:hypothetical protein
VKCHDHIQAFWAGDSPRYHSLTILQSSHESPTGFVKPGTTPDDHLLGAIAARMVQIKDPPTAARSQRNRPLPIQVHNSEGPPSALA